MSKTTTTNVAIQHDKHTAIRFQCMEFEGDQVLLLAIMSGGETSSFFFDDPHEVIRFAERVIEAAKNHLGE